MLRLFACEETFFVPTSKARSEDLAAHGRSSGIPAKLWKVGILLSLLLAALQLPAREKDATQYGAGLIVNLPFSDKEVAQVVQDVIQNGLIRGTKEYNKDEYITGAAPAASTKVFKEWTEGGQVFYKVRLKALDPRNFKDGGDMGTLAVRYIVQPQGDKNTVLRIDAVFVEDFRKVSHASNGSVESAEYKDIHDRLDSIESMKAQTVEAEKEKQEQLAKKPPQPVPVDETPATVPRSASVPSVQLQSAPAITTTDAPAPAPPPNEVPANGAAPAAQTLEEHVHDLRRQIERLVKAPGAPLKSAPFHTASTLQSLPAGTEVLIVISTPYWFGIETRDGQYGWMLRDQLEQAP
jgi:hypothetical protein